MIKRENDVLYLFDGEGILFRTVSVDGIERIYTKDKVCVLECQYDDFDIDEYEERVRNEGIFAGISSKDPIPADNANLYMSALDKQKLNELSFNKHCEFTSKNILSRDAMLSSIKQFITDIIDDRNIYSSFIDSEDIKFIYNRKNLYPYIVFNEYPNIYYSLNQFRECIISTDSTMFIYHTEIKIEDLSEENLISIYLSLEECDKLIKEEKEKIFEIKEDIRKYVNKQIEKIFKEKRGNNGDI